MLFSLLPLLPGVFHQSELPSVSLNTLKRSLQGSCFQSSPENPARSSLEPSASRGAASAALIPVALPSLEAMKFLVEGKSTLFFRAQMGLAAGLPPGRRVQKREESIQKENAFHNKWKFLKPDPWVHSVPQVSKLPCEHPFHLSLEMRNRVVFLKETLQEL